MASARHGDDGDDEPTLASTRLPNGETGYVELSPTGVRRLAGGEGSIVRLSNADVATRHRHPQGIKWMSLNRLMRLREEERERSRLGGQWSRFLEYVGKLKASRRHR